ncbi:MAG TPA: hypothetical protein PLL75_04485 [Candidatus Omnitrophota bacterium]|nr:hypothetical protein [Candidatus Omnitrophota bacterium]HPS36968.1 hypothetical protein [Candidatus Omnitrophota bacterium]
MKKIGTLALSFVFLVQGAVFGEVTMQDLRLPKGFYPAGQSPYASIVSVKDEPAAPGFLVFSLSSPDGVYTVHGLAALRKCLHEIDVLVQMKNNEGTGDGVAAGAVDSLKDTGTGLKNLAIHPVDSVSGIGKGIGKLGGKIGGAFRKKEEGEKTSASEGLLGSTKRDLAKKFGIDVYTRNEKLQERLNSMAKARMGGRGIVAVATFFVPAGLIASAVITVSNINNAADELVNDSDRADLFQMNQKALMDLGFSKEKTVAFLNNPYYTPREQTYMRFYLEKLKAAQGLEAVLDAATAATTEIPADKILHETQIAADSVAEDSPALRVEVASEGLLVEKEKSVVMATAYDYLTASPLSDQVEKKVLRFKKESGKSSAEIRNGGAVDSKWAAVLFLKGLRVQKMCLFSSTAGEKDPAV